VRRIAVLLGFCTLTAIAVAQQPAAKRDPQALTILQRSLSAMGGVPNDVRATGFVTITAGSATDSGTIKILARGFDKTVEEIQTPGGSRAEIFSAGEGGSKQGLTVEAKSLEWAASAQSGAIPSLLIASALNSSDGDYEYVGLEDLAGVKAHHVRLSASFASRPKLKHLREFSGKELWIDASSLLPLKLSFDRRDGQGAVPRIPIAYHYSDYRAVGGVFIPFQIQKDYNGTPWATIRLSSVSVNAGISDSAFAVKGEAQ